MSEAAVTRFLNREARLMDQHAYSDWLSLWVEDEDAIYWIPCNDDDIDPTRQVSIIYDDRIRLEQRIDRLRSGSVLPQDPKQRLKRLVSNVEILEDKGEHLVVRSSFIVVAARGGVQELWAGDSIHTLRRSGEDFRIAGKKVLLINNDQEMPLLQFLI